jgi:protein ImuB
MYACLSAPDADPAALADLASRFSPVIETREAGIVVFAINGLGRLIGDTHQIASEIARRAEERGIRGQLAIASNPDTAELAARHRPGVTIVVPGREAEALGGLPLRVLIPYCQPETLRTLEHWGVHTLADLAALPGLGLIERFGEEGDRLRKLASGQAARPLDIATSREEFVAATELEHEITLLEPLLFVLNTLLREALTKVTSYGLAANQITLTLNTQTRKLEFPIPVTEASALLKQLQLDLEAHPFGHAVRTVHIELRPTSRRGKQNGFFTPPVPEPEKLQTILARLTALVGSENVGSPELLDTHRPDAYQMLPFTAIERAPREIETRNTLAFRRYRPVVPARVQLEQARPVRVETSSMGGLGGKVQQAAGPWKSSGDWWGDQRWSREEWDIALSDGGLYRLYQAWGNWFLEGEYD